MNKTEVIETYTIRRLIPGEEVNKIFAGRTFVGIPAQVMARAKDSEWYICKFGTEEMKISWFAHWVTERSFIDHWNKSKQYFLLYFDWNPGILSATACSDNFCGQCGPTWSGGINRKLRNTKKYKDWRNLVYAQRDGICCWKCGSSKQLEVDHFPASFAQLLKQYNISSVKQALETPELWETENGRVLCHDCHSKTGSYMRPLAQHPSAFLSA